MKRLRILSTAVTLGGSAALANAELGDLEALRGVVKFPVRIKCATLAWNTLAQALADSRDG